MVSVSCHLGWSVECRYVYTELPKPLQGIQSGSTATDITQCSLLSYSLIAHCNFYQKCSSTTRSPAAPPDRCSSIPRFADPSNCNKCSSISGFAEQLHQRSSISDRVEPLIRCVLLMQGVCCSPAKSNQLKARHSAVAPVCAVTNAPVTGCIPPWACPTSKVNMLVSNGRKAYWFTPPVSPLQHPDWFLHKPDRHT